MGADVTSKTPVWLYQGDMREVVPAQLGAGTSNGNADAVITSPPYWHQRRYPVEDLVWGPDSGAHRQCAHSWVEISQYQDSPVRAEVKRWAEIEPEDTRDERWLTSAACRYCWAWRGQLGLEPELDCAGYVRGEQCTRCYVCHMRQVGRVMAGALAPTGSVMLILGDTTSTVGRKTSIGYGIPAAGNQCLVPARVALGWQADGWTLHQTGVWSKTSVAPSGNRPGKWRRADETILHFTLGSTPHTSELMPLHGSVITATPGRALNGHNAPGSESLAGVLISLLQPATVLDPFMGEGTVGRAAQRAGVAFVGVDLSPEAVETARRSLIPELVPWKAEAGESSE